MLRVDKKGEHNLAQNLSIGGITRHVDVWMAFIQELNEEGILELEWIPGIDNASDLFTKTYMDHCLNLLARTTIRRLKMAAKLSTREGVKWLKCGQHGSLLVGHP